jgi:hypothetical protein
MLSPESFFRNGLATIFERMGRNHVRFNAFRRFRESVLLKSECRQILIDYWMGHENPDMSTRYGRQLVEDVKYRKEWAEKWNSASSFRRYRSLTWMLVALRALQTRRSRLATQMRKLLNRVINGRGERI